VTNIRLGLKRVTAESTLAYYSTDLVTDVKSFILQVAGVKDTCFFVETSVAKKTKNSFKTLKVEQFLAKKIHKNVPEHSLNGNANCTEYFLVYRK